MLSAETTLALLEMLYQHRDEMIEAAHALSDAGSRQDMKEHILSGTAKGHTVTLNVNEQRGITLAEITSLELSDHDVLTVIAFLRGVSARHEHPARHEKEDDRLQLYYTVENGLNQVTISRGGPIKIELALATALRLLHTLEEEYKDEIR